MFCTRNYFEPEAHGNSEKPIYKMSRVIVLSLSFSVTFNLGVLDDIPRIQFNSGNTFPIETIDENFHVGILSEKFYKVNFI